MDKKRIAEISENLTLLLVEVFEAGQESGADLTNRKYQDSIIEAEKRSAENEKRPERMLNAVKTVCIDQKIMSKPRLYKLIDQGKIKATKLGRAWMISESEMRRLHLML